MRRLALAAATAACGLALALGFGEGLVRVVAGPPARFFYGGSFRDVQTDFDVVYGVSGRGLRRTCGPEPGAEAPRIGVLGDSFVFGQGVADCEDFVSLLDRESPRVRFVNLGAIGSGIDEYRIVARDLVGGMTGVVVVFFGNDVSQLKNARSFPGRLARASSLVGLLRHVWRASLLKRALRQMQDEGGAMAFFGGRPNNVASVLRQDPEAMRAMVEPPPEQAALFRRRFGELADSLVARFGASNVRITCVPDGQTVSRPLAAFIREQGGSVAPFGAPGTAYELVRALAQERGLFFINVFPGFAADGDFLYHRHDLHWTPAGHRRMAELLAAPLGVAPAQPRRLPLLSKPPLPQVPAARSPRRTGSRPDAPTGRAL